MREEELVWIGKIVKIHGIKGKVKLFPPSETLHSFSSQQKLYLFFPKDKNIEIYHLISVQSARGTQILKLKGIDSVEKAKPLVGCSVFLEKETLPHLEKGEYYFYQLKGLRVYTQSGRYIGKLTDIFSTGSNDVYVVKDKYKEYLIPAIEDVVKEIDLNSKKMIINPLEGLLEQ